MQRLSRMFKASRSRQHGGFTTLQMVITIAIVAVVTTFGVLGIRNARAEMRVQNSARRFAVYVERARADSIRRHAQPGSEATVETFGPNTNTFNVRMDFDGTGNLQTRTFTLDEGVIFNTIAQTATFDWRGRVPERLAFQIANEIRSIPVDISGSGDITVGDQIFGDNAIPAIVLAEVTNDVNTNDPTPYPTAAPEESPSESPTPEATPTPDSGNGNGNGNGDGSGNGNGSGNGTGDSSPTPTPIEPTPSPTAYPSPSPIALDCASSVSTTFIELSQSDSSRQTQTIYFTLSNASSSHTVSVSLAGHGSPLDLSVSPSTLTGDGTARVTIGAKNGSGNRGTFVVNISASPACGSTHQVSVSVGN